MQDDVALLKELSQIHQTLRRRLGEIIVGQQAVLEEMSIALFAEGHVLLVGVPGLAKTRIVRTLAELLQLEFRRIQFTPDLLPTDITGTEIIRENRETGQRELVFLPGPIFANILLADEINRTPPKTQSALLEAMQERQVTVGGRRHVLAPPFFVLATQNPIEQEGTYPLPEAQLDRFMLNVMIDYPASDAEEVEIVLRTTGEPPEPRSPLLEAGRLRDFQDLVLAHQELPAVLGVHQFGFGFFAETLGQVLGVRQDVESTLPVAVESGRQGIVVHATPTSFTMVSDLNLTR